MRVYRIENDKHVGPYQGMFATPEQEALGREHNDDRERWPSGMLDFDWEDLTSHMRFACATLDRLIEWFGEHIDPIMSVGFDLVVYEVPVQHIKVGNSGKQVVFDDRYATKIAA